MNSIDKIIDEAKRIEEDSIYSAKGHFCTAKRWEKANFYLGIISAIAATLAGASAVSKLEFYNIHFGAIIAGVSSIVAAVLVSILTFVNPNKKAASHFNAGNCYKELQNDTRVFRIVEFVNLDEEVAKEKLNILNSRRNKLNRESDQIPDWAFEKARKGIEEGEANYSVDNEVHKDEQN